MQSNAGGDAYLSKFFEMWGSLKSGKKRPLKLHKFKQKCILPHIEGKRASRMSDAFRGSF